MRGDLNTKATISFFTPEKVEEGDHLLLKSTGSPDGKARYHIDKLTPCRDPWDMYFADVTFIPRKFAQFPDGHIEPVPDGMSEEEFANAVQQRLP